MHGKRADITAGEEQRRNNVAVRCHRNIAFEISQPSRIAVKLDVAFAELGGDAITNQSPQHSTSLAMGKRNCFRD
jgi:hypothetical protein